MLICMYVWLQKNKRSTQEYKQISKFIRFLILSEAQNVLQLIYCTKKCISSLYVVNFLDKISVPIFTCVLIFQQEIINILHSEWSGGEIFNFLLNIQKNQRQKRRKNKEQQIGKFIWQQYLFKRFQTQISHLINKYNIHE